ncbi:MAG TPA: cytochrome c [Kiloniellaceae bacterium]|nr:cytochrome c [Kiloniellaceae bacterium]
MIAPWKFLPLAALLLAPHVGLAQDAQKGRELAVTHCSRCHVIPDHNAFGGIGSTPSFQLLANLDDGLERFETFFARRPHPSVVRLEGVTPPSEQAPTIVPVALEPDDIDDLAAYARSLRQSKN